MKYLILTAALVAPLAAAEVYFVTPNEGGGEIVLTEVKVAQCGETLRVAYAQLPGGDVLYGCWGFMQDKVHVRYMDGQRRVYDPKGFAMKESK